MVAKIGEVLATKDVDAAPASSRPTTTAMDELHRQVFDHLLAQDRWPRSTRRVDVTLLGRYYERYADHAVSVARRVVYLVTGERAARRDAARPAVRDAAQRPWFATASIAAAAASGSR